jgi:hypothetical protein
MIWYSRDLVQPDRPGQLVLQRQRADMQRGSMSAPAGQVQPFMLPVPYWVDRLWRSVQVLRHWGTKMERMNRLRRVFVSREWRSALPRIPAHC